MAKAEFGLANSEFNPEVIRHYGDEVSTAADLYRYLIKNGLRSRNKLTREEKVNGVEAANRLANALWIKVEEGCSDEIVNFPLKNADGTSWLFWARRIP